jgi:hypothetical protein
MFSLFLDIFVIQIKDVFPVNVGSPPKKNGYRKKPLCGQQFPIDEKGQS